MTTRTDKRPALAIYIDCNSAQRLDALCLLQWFSRQPLEDAGIQVCALQTAGRASRSDLRNQVLDLKAAEFIAFIDPVIEINWPALAAAAEWLQRISKIDCVSIEETQAKITGEEILIKYGLGNPIQTSAQSGSKFYRRPANPRCFWRTELVHDLKFGPAQTNDELEASEFAWSLKAAARCEVSQHFPLIPYRLIEATLV